MFSDYKVSRKYFYNPGLPIWMDVNVRHVCGGRGWAVGQISTLKLQHFLSVRVSRKGFTIQRYTPRTRQLVVLH